MTHLDDLFAGLPAKLDVPAVADLLGMTTKGVYGWIHSGVILRRSESTTAQALA